MVPYVRKSFRKHYNTALSWVDGEHYKNNAKELDALFTEPVEKVSIIDERYTNLAPKAHAYAMERTIKEVHQAVEGLYHNLKI